MECRARKGVCTAVRARLREAGPSAGDDLGDLHGACQRDSEPVEGTSGAPWRCQESTYRREDEALVKFDRSREYLFKCCDRVPSEKRDRMGSAAICGVA